MSKIYKDGKVDESQMTFKQIQVMNTAHKYIILDVYKKTISRNKSKIIINRYSHLLASM